MDWLRNADWLTRERVRGYALLLAPVSLGVLAISYINAMAPAGTDFLAFWGAGRAVVGGDPAAAYDLALQERIQTATGSTGLAPRPRITRTAFQQAGCGRAGYLAEQHARGACATAGGCTG